MNANELADYLDNNVEAMLMSEQPHIDQAATMLRQQQAEIEALKQSKFDANNKVNLTDEEILKMAADKFHYSEYKLVIEFARAILRKAQEK
jgi:hypothetical protein